MFHIIDHLNVIITSTSLPATFYKRSSEIQTLRGEKQTYMGK